MLTDIGSVFFKFKSVRKIQYCVFCFAMSQQRRISPRNSSRSFAYQKEYSRNSIRHFEYIMLMERHYSSFSIPHSRSVVYVLCTRKCVLRYHVMQRRLSLSLGAQSPVSARFVFFEPCSAFWMQRKAMKSLEIVFQRQTVASRQSVVYNKFDLLNNKETWLTEVLKVLSEHYRMGGREWSFLHNHFVLSFIISTVSFRTAQNKMKALNVALKASIATSWDPRPAAAVSLRKPLFLPLSSWSGGYAAVSYS